MTPTITSDQIKEAAKADGVKMADILPASWSSNDDFDVTDAIRAYILNRDTGKNLQSLLGDEPTPKHEFWSSGHGDSCCYRVYEDNSLWYQNNAEDEVWWDYTEFITRSLLSGLHAQNYYNSVCFTEDEYAASEHPHAWLLDNMDRRLLLLYCDDDEAEAKKLFGV